MTRARIVTPGQARAMIPTIMARTPRRIRDVDRDLNMTGIPFVWPSPHCVVFDANLCRAQWTRTWYCRLYSSSIGIWLPAFDQPGGYAEVRAPARYRGRISS